MLARPLWVIGGRVGLREQESALPQKADMPCGGEKNPLFARSRLTEKTRVRDRPLRSPPKLGLGLRTPAEFPERGSVQLQAANPNPLANLRSRGERSHPNSFRHSY